MGADRLIQADCSKRRPIYGAVFALCCAVSALVAGPAAASSSAPTVAPSTDPSPDVNPSGPPEAQPDSLPRGAIDELLEAWSDLYLGHAPDSLGALDLDSTSAAPTESLAATPRAPEAREGLRVVVFAGSEVEGLDESFGFESLSPLTSATPPTEETPGTVADTTFPAPVRFVERETALRAVLGLTAATAPTSALDASLRFESRTGRERADVVAEVSGAPRRGRWRSFSLRDLYLWDRNDDGTTTGQNLLYLRWRQPAGADGWRLGLNGTLDISRSDDAGVVIEPSGSASPDSTLRLNYLNHERCALRFELWQPGLHGTTLALTFNRKTVDRIASGSYSAGVVTAHRTWFLAPGLLDIDLDLERRSYDDEGSAIGSYWESELRTRWLGEGRSRRLDADLRAVATLHDEPATGGEDLLGLLDDHITVQCATLVRQGLAGGGDPAGARVAGWAWEGALGPTAELVRTRSGDGDAAALGLRLESALRRSGESSPYWIDGSAEFGWRVYGDPGGGGRFAYEGFRLSLAQTDYRYGQVSIVAGGQLPWSLTWEGYLSYDQEWHALADDNARLISFSLSLQRLWVLWPGWRADRQPH